MLRDMNNWKSLLRADPTEWLLEKDNPSVRCFTLTDILDKPENDSEVREAKDEIQKHPLVMTIHNENLVGGQIP